MPVISKLTLTLTDTLLEAHGISTISQAYNFNKLLENRFVGTHILFYTFPFLVDWRRLRVHDMLFLGSTTPAFAIDSVPVKTLNDFCTVETGCRIIIFGCAAPAASPDCHISVDGRCAALELELTSRHE